MVATFPAESVQQELLMVDIVVVILERVVVGALQLRQQDNAVACCKNIGKVDGLV